MTTASAYPAAADTFTESKTIAGQHDVFLDDLIRHNTINKLSAAVAAEQAELGLDPAGGSSTVVARADAVDTAVALNTLRAFANPVTVGAGATTVTQASATRIVTCTLTAETVTLGNGGAGLGFGGIALLILPAGSIWRVESTILDIDIPTALTVIDASDNGDLSLGQVVTVAGALTATEATFVVKSALAYDTKLEVRNDTAHDIDATSGAVSLFLNATVDDGDVGDLSSTPATWAVTGTVTITLTDMGGIA